MAYMSQDHKAALAPKIKEICKRYGVKASLSVRNHMELCLTVKSGKIDFIDSFNQIGRRSNHRNFGQGWVDAKDYLDVNPYWYKDQYDGDSYHFLNEVFKAMNEGNHDNSDAMTDYFDRGWYVAVQVGKWNKPYVIA